MAEVIKHEQRPNKNFENLFNFSGILFHYCNSCQDDLFREQFQRILDEIENIFEHVEQSDNVPEGHRSVDEIIDEGWKLINGALNNGAIKYIQSDDLRASPVEPIKV